MYRRLLMAYDGSREGLDALLASPDLVHFREAELHLLAVLPIPGGLYLAESLVPELVLEEQAGHYRRILDAALSRLRAQGRRADGGLSHGEPVEAIVAKARELGVDLIVLGHRYRSAFGDRWWKGAAGGYLMEQAPCSLLVVVGQGPEPPVL